MMFLISDVNVRPQQATQTSAEQLIDMPAERFSSVLYTWLMEWKILCISKNLWRLFSFFFLMVFYIGSRLFFRCSDLRVPTIQHWRTLNRLLSVLNLVLRLLDQSDMSNHLCLIPSMWIFETASWSESVWWVFFLCPVSHLSGGTLTCLCLSPSVLCSN